MNIKTILSFILFFHCLSFINAQTNLYTIEKTSFSSQRFDEFAPVFYNEGIVFCSNRRSSSLINYSNDANRALFDIYFVEVNKKGKWKKPDLFSKEITTKLNDGPVTFSADGKLVYFSRNMIVGHKLKKSLYNRNKLGIYSANLVDDQWMHIREFRYNNDWFNVSTPCLSPDGQRMYFSSDQPDGYGGSDIYYCEWENGYWGDPVNLGPDINTEKNEAYPFVNHVGELYFSSDGHNGFGGKDIFVTKEKEEGWYLPKNLAAPINSEFDDFGIVTDSLGQQGYFSTNRDRSIDIYRFKAIENQVWFSEAQRQNNYCISLQDTGAIVADTLRLEYEWDFGQGIKKYGKQIRHCFPGAGEYQVNVHFVDKRSKKKFFHKSSYQISVSDIEQPYIESSSYAMIGETIAFDAGKSYFSNDEIVDYFWQIDDNVYKKGVKISHAFNQPGEKLIKLGLVLRSRIDGKIVKKAVHKKVWVFTDQYLKSQKEARSSLKELADSNNNFKIVHTYFADNKLNPLSLFRLEVYSSPNRIPISSSIFNKIPSKYGIQEVFQEEDATFRYYISENYDMMSLYPTYKDLVASGFERPLITFHILTDPVKMELIRILLKYGDQWDSFFNSDTRLTTNGILMLNNIVGLMNRNSDLKLEVGVHTDDLDPSAKNMERSNLLAKKMVDYLVGSGIAQYRLLPKGYGDEFPIRSNLLDTGREKNRRVEFKLIE